MRQENALIAYFSENSSIKCSQIQKLNFKLLVYFVETEKYYMELNNIKYDPIMLFALKVILSNKFIAII